jgi:probable rRNA maturation factor
MNQYVVDVQCAEALAQSSIDVALVERAVIATLQHCAVAGHVEVSVYVTTATEIHQLNREYRHIDAPTDVLSFADDGDAPSAFVPPPDMPRYLGDIAISWQHVLQQARDYGHSEARELAFLTVHGVLHLLGFDHERGAEEDAQMRHHQDAIMVHLQLPRV